MLDSRFSLLRLGSGQNSVDKLYNSTLSAKDRMGEIQNKFLEKIYLFIISENFPLWLALISIFSIIIDYTYTFQVLFNDKTYFLLSETNSFFKYALQTNNWFFYSITSISFYFISILLAKKIVHPLIRGILFLSISIRIVVMSSWFLPTNVVVISGLSLIVTVFVSLEQFTPKIKIEKTPPNASLVLRLQNLLKILSTEQF